MGSPFRNYPFHLFLDCQNFPILLKIKKLWTSSFTPSKGGIFSPFSSLGNPSSSSSSLESSVSINSGDFGAFLGCRAFLTFFPAFAAAFFLSLEPDTFLGFYSPSLEHSFSINPGDFSAFLSCGVFLALFLLWRLIIYISFI